MIPLYLFLALVALYLIFCFFPAVVMFRSIFFHRSESLEGRDKDYYKPYAPLLSEARRRLEAIPATEVSVTARDGTRLVGEYRDRGADRTAILFHGYRAAPMSNCAYAAALFSDAGYNTLLVFSRAHGKSGGRYTTLGYLEQQDVRDWIAFAEEQGHTRRIALYGVSMGAACIAFGADQLPPSVRAMVLDCGFSGIYDQLVSDSRKRHLPAWITPPLLRLFYRLRFGYDIKTPVGDTLCNTRVPALFLHGTADGSVPLAQGEANYAACASPKEWVPVAGADHTCALLQGGDPVRETLLAFLNAHIPQTEPSQGVPS